MTAKEEIAALIAKAIETEDDKVSNAENFDYEYSFEFHYADCARAVLTALSAAGFVVVPREPTEAMLIAGELAFEENVEAAPIYKAMLSAYEESK